MMVMMQSFQSSSSLRSKFGQVLTCRYGRYRLVTSSSERFFKEHVLDKTESHTPSTLEKTGQANVIMFNQRENIEENAHFYQFNSAMSF